MPGCRTAAPYKPLTAGRYRLDVFGAGEVPAGAYADVVSSDASLVHGRFPLRAGSSGILVDGGSVLIDANADRVEVRVWVGKGSKLQLTGYRLARDLR